MKHVYKIASCSWPDHLVFGEDDGTLNSVDALARRMDIWHETYKTEIVHWREVYTRRYLSTYYAGPDNPRTQEKKIKAISWNDFIEVPKLAHQRNMKVLLYVSVFDDGRPLQPSGERRNSYHNKMHGQHVSWQTNLSRDNSDFVMSDRTGDSRQWGVFCFGHYEVREHIKARILKYMDESDFDGVFICTRSQCRPADFADQFGFNKPVRDDFLRIYGQDIFREDFNLGKWRALLGDYFTIFLKELSGELHSRGRTLSVGIPRGEVIGPPLGNWHIQWRKWVKEGFIDELVIDQNSSSCPSMWHELWPMHRGYGYIQNYINGKGLKPLVSDLRETYAPVLSNTACKLFVARQWVEPNLEKEAELLSAGVDGLAFSTFRFDNPDVVRRGDFFA